MSETKTKIVIDRSSGDSVALLLLLEDRAVNNGGRVNGQCMNEADMERVKEWNEAGFVRFGRIAFQGISNGGSHWVELSDEAWEEAGRLRTERGKRLWSKRKFQTTEESRNDQ